MLSVSICSLAFSHSDKEFHKRVVTITFCYNPPDDKREISMDKPLSIVCSDLDNSSYWNTGFPSVALATNGKYLRAIEFNAEPTPDGPADGALSEQEALNAVEQFFEQYDTLLNDIRVIPASHWEPQGETWIYLKRSNDNGN